MSITRPLVHGLFLLLACGACDGANRQRATTTAAIDSTGIDAVRDATIADAAARRTRLRLLQATRDDLAARDSLDIRVEVDIEARRVRVLDAVSDTLAQYDVAVGSAEWPTRKGEWTISQVVLNPEWIPPIDEAWAEDADSSAPGDPDNPLGHAQLVYDLPRSIHGTNAPASIGKAGSHGSIRTTNEAVLALAELLLVRTGVERATQRVQQAQRERTVKQVIDLPQLVPIRVY